MASIEQRIQQLLDRMTLTEKIGQLAQVQAGGGHVPAWLADAIRQGRIGSVINEVHLDTVNELQRIAVEESRLGIPLLVGRDVIHGFKTVFPIPLGQAATWNPDRIARAARVAALEAAGSGVNWTFAPVADIGRDPRWGRVAEGFGEDPYLTGLLGVAVVRGFQGEDLTAPGSVAACGKHFAGYGASEAGRDYNTTNIPENELRNVHLPPFRALVEAGVLSVMTSFSDLDGVPATANDFLLRRILRTEWGFDGLVVSDWDSIPQLAVHGVTADDRESAAAAANAGVDMEMASGTYAHHLASLVEEERVSPERLDAMVADVLRVKLRLGLFERPVTDPERLPPPLDPSHLELARELARESVVLLKNDDRLLPLSSDRLGRLAVIGPLADDPYEQLGTWIFDGDVGASRTVLQAVREHLGDGVRVEHARGLANTRSRDTSGFAEALALAEGADAVLLVLGEEAILSGEAHCRADIRLPGAQEALIAEVAKTGKPVVLVLMAGRALALEGVVDQVAAVLYAWHPGTMGGPAIADLLFGVASPSGKLPVTLPRVTGQIPIYYAHKNTGKPPTPGSFVPMEEIDPGVPQLSVGNTSFHLDVHYTPLFPFGYGLSYGSFVYRELRASASALRGDETVELSVEVANVGEREAEETVQLYVRDLVGSVTRPVRELKAFEKVRLGSGEHRTVSFTLGRDQLAFYGRGMRRVTEPGVFHVWIGGSSEADLRAELVLID